MVEVEITSKKHGKFKCLVDDRDYVFMRYFDNGSGKWCITLNRDKFYVQKRTSQGVVYLHRLISRAPKGKYVDHINGNTLDNQRINLRVCKNSSNLRNARIRPNNTSGVNGVFWNKSRKKWESTIKVNYKKINLGRFRDFDDAVNARKEAEIRYWSE